MTTAEEEEGWDQCDNGGVSVVEGMVARFGGGGMAKGMGVA